MLPELLAHPELSDGGFDWLSVLKYHMEIRTILRAKSEMSSETSDLQTIDALDLRSHSGFGKYIMITLYISNFSKLQVWI